MRFYNLNWNYSIMLVFAEESDYRVNGNIGSLITEHNHGQNPMETDFTNFSSLGNIVLRDLAFESHF